MAQLSALGLITALVSEHLKKNHRIRVTMEDVLGFLRIEGNAMTLAEAEL